jgi:predicted secreted protein
MKPFAAVAVALLLLSLPAAAAETAGATPRDATMLHLNEQARRQVPRDRLVAVLRIEGADADVARLQSDINQRLAAAVARAKAVAGVTLTTGGYYVYQDRPKERPAQWRGSASLTLDAKETAPLLALVGGLQQSGLVLSSLGYELSPEATRAVEDELTAEALARLRLRAQRVAQRLGLSVVRISDLHLGNAGGTPPVPRLFAAAAPASMSAAAALPVAEPGEATVSVAVEADIELRPKR